MLITYLTGKDNKGNPINRLLVDAEIISDDIKICEFVFNLISKLRYSKGHGENIVLSRIDNIKNITLEVEL